MNKLPNIKPPWDKKPGGSLSKRFANHFKELRDEKGLSLRKCAKAIGVSVAYLSRIENGYVYPVPEWICRSLSSKLNTDENQLMALGGRVRQEVIESIIKNPGRKF